NPGPECHRLEAEGGRCVAHRPQSCVLRGTPGRSHSRCARLGGGDRLGRGSARTIAHRLEEPNRRCRRNLDGAPARKGRRNSPAPLCESCDSGGEAASRSSSCQSRLPSEERTRWNFAGGNPETPISRVSPSERLQFWSIASRASVKESLCTMPASRT